MLPKFFVLPAVLLAAATGWIAWSPGQGPAVDRLGATLVEDASETAGPSETPTPASVTKATATPATSLPPGTSGQLTYRSVDELITVRLPDLTERTTQPWLGQRGDNVSADGEWRARYVGDAGLMELHGPDGAIVMPRLTGELVWAPAGHRYAMKVYHEFSQELLVVDDPLADDARSVLTGPAVWAFDWDAAGDALIVATLEEDGAHISRLALDETLTELADVKEVPLYWYRSPDGARFAFTTSARGEGWHMQVFDAATLTITDLGPMGSDGPDGQPIEARPDQKSAIDVQWSPDGSTIAFGGGLEPPYTMTIVDVVTGAKAQATFAEGYAGEILWSPDGTRVAVSTYDPERTRHEVYAVDPATGAARYLASGCHIVWSPDGRFIAYRGEDTQGVGIVDTYLGLIGQVTHGAADFPMAWER